MVFRALVRTLRFFFMSAPLTSARRRHHGLALQRRYLPKHRIKTRRSRRPILYTGYLKRLQWIRHLLRRGGRGRARDWVDQGGGCCAVSCACRASSSVSSDDPDSLVRLQWRSSVLWIEGIQRLPPRFIHLRSFKRLLRCASFYLLRALLWLTPLRAKSHYTTSRTRLR